MSWSSLVERQFLSDGGEQFPNILSCLGGRLEEQQAGFARIRLGLGCRNGPFIWLFGDEIQLVSGESDDDVLVGLALELFDPCLGLV